MQTVTKRELVQRIAEKTGVQQISAKEVIQSFLDEIINELAKGNRLEFRDFGVFEPKNKAQRVARNPRTGERVEVPEKTTSSTVLPGVPREARWERRPQILRATRPARLPAVRRPGASWAAAWERLAAASC